MKNKSLHQGGIFVVGSLIAGLLNYFFQVVAARELQPADFAALNAWLAHISLLSVSAGLLQYAANFFPSRKTGLRISIVAFNVLALGMLWFWFSHQGLTLERAITVVVATSLFGWLIGQAQIRLSFITMTIAGLIFGAAKLATVFLPIAPEGDLERFALGLFAGYLPGLWVLSLFLWNMAEPEKKVKRSWTAPIILSLTAVLVPQFDMVLMNHTQRPDIFESFVKASLFYKCIYFWVFIGAQWLLPHQIQGKAGSTMKGLSLTFAGALLGALVLTGASPYISTWLLHWAMPPTTSLVFWSCLHMSLLTMLFLWIQEMCAHRRPQLAAVVLSILGMEAAAQWLLRLPASTYLTFVTVVQLILLITAYVLSGHLSLGPRQKDALPPPLVEN